MECRERLATVIQEAYGLGNSTSKLLCTCTVCLCTCVSVYMNIRLQRLKATYMYIYMYMCNPPEVVRQSEVGFEPAAYMYLIR